MTVRGTMQAIEERCNEVIRSGAAVNQVIVSDSNRQAVANSKLMRGALPPADKVSGPVRMIEIEGVDINACGGYATFSLTRHLQQRHSLLLVDQRSQSWRN